MAKIKNTTCTVEECEKRIRARGYCDTHYKRFQATGTPLRPCANCGKDITGTFGPKVYCSDDCRPLCPAPGCDRVTIGRVEYCGSHMSSMYKHGRLPEYTWAAEKLCVICGSVHDNPKRRKVCSDRCQQRLYRATHAPSAKQREILEKLKDCNLCGEIIDLTVIGKGGRKKRADVKLCDACRRAKYVRHKMSVTLLAKRDGTTCGICSDPVDMTLVFPDLFRASVDHIVPYAQSGSHDPSNLQLVHLWCNLVKSDKAGFTL